VPRRGFPGCSQGTSQECHFFSFERLTTARRQEYIPLTHDVGRCFAQRRLPCLVSLLFFKERFFGLLLRDTHEGGQALRRTAGHGLATDGVMVTCSLTLW
jgi:hypothetical protein